MNDAVKPAVSDEAIRAFAKERGLYLRESASVPDIVSGGWKHPFTVTLSGDELRALVSFALTAPAQPLDPDEELYEIGVREGYERAVQEIDQLTGGDGEYRYCTDRDPERHTPDAPSMIQRIVDRFETLNLLNEATATGSDEPDDGPFAPAQPVGVPEKPIAHLVWLQGRRAADDVDDYYEVARPGDKCVDGSDPFPVYAAPQPPAEDEWRDIASAPKNKKILAAYRNDLGKWRIVTACYHTQLDWSDEYGDHEQEFAPEAWYKENESSEVIYPTSHQPSHWMPLPPAPANGGEQNG